MFVFVAQNLGKNPSRLRNPLLSSGPAELVSERMGAEHYGEERAETAKALPELIIAEELKRGQWQEADLKTWPKGDAMKVALAARLRAETTMTVEGSPSVWRWARAVI